MDVAVHSFCFRREKTRRLSDKKLIITHIFWHNNSV